MTPIYFRWTGDQMVPLPRFLNFARKQFEVDAEYRLDVHEERSTNSHRHYFAAVKEAWKNLPEEMAKDYPSEEHLRKRALIKCGFYTERSIVCDNKKEAQRVGAFVGQFDEYAVVTVKENVVKVYRAMSQSTRAMEKDTFQKSKQAVLDLLSSVIGVKTAELRKQGERA